MGRRDGRRRFEGTAEIIGPVPKRAAKVGCDRVHVDSHAGVGVEPRDGYVAQFSRASRLSHVAAQPSKLVPDRQADGQHQAGGHDEYEENRP